MLIRTLIFSLLLIISGCGSQSSSGELNPDWIYDAVPMTDALQAIEKGDFRFRGVYSYSLIVPGVKMECIDTDTDIFPIEGTSDASTTYEERKFNALAMIYADVYNFQMKSYLETIGEFSCD